MKRLILICGPNGVGKSTVCRELTGRLGHTAFIDSDACRFMVPFSFSQEEVSVILSNISTMMINYFGLSTVSNVLFQYGFHGVRKAIFDRILKTVSEAGVQYAFCPVILHCSLEENIRRMREDGRDPDRINRAVSHTRALYDAYPFPRIDTTGMSVSQTVEAVMKVLSDTYPMV